jgi:hypothetical protein
MGMDAKACLWVGFRSEDGDFSDLAAKLTGSNGDFELQTIECSEEDTGFGIVIFSHDWDYGVVEFDASAIQHKVDKARAAMTALLDEHAIDLDVGVWFQTDFS